MEQLHGVRVELVDHWLFAPIGSVCLQTSGSRTECLWCWEGGDSFLREEVRDKVIVSEEKILARL